MQNVEVSIEGEVLILKIDLSVALGPTKGKRNSMSVATSSGPVLLYDGVSGRYREEKFNLNVYRPFRAGESREPRRDD